MNERWRRVSHQDPCPICGKSDWCTTSADGRTVCCMRIESTRSMKNGGWAHAVGDRSARRETPQAAKPVAPTTTDLAAIEKRDAVYRALLAELGLSDEHRAHLLNVRRLPAEVLPLFASLPAMDEFTDRRNLMARVRKSAGCSLHDIPGTYVSAHGWRALVKAPAGILIPALDPLGRIQALQVRADQPGPDQPRYTWLSSAKWPRGCSSGSPVAVWRPSMAQADVWLTEGSLKACIASYRLQACVVAVAGVAGWRPALETLSALGAKSATIAYDTDFLTKPEVAFHREALSFALERAGYTVRLASWNACHKGIDDALLAGVQIHTAPATRYQGLRTRGAITLGRRIATIPAKEVARCLH
ncbi:MAG: DUF3854 domain-containing protein [Chloroflexota bacterium]|nr:MAG: DUF3854 domain-containing protein [Chloroflexota bacterium]